MFRSIKDALFRSTERVMRAVYRPAIEVIIVYGFRLWSLLPARSTFCPLPRLFPNGRNECWSFTCHRI